MNIETDYARARELFVQSAEAAGLRTFRNRVPYEGIPELFIDFALEKRDPARALVLLSGTHGIEGYAGSHIQRELLNALPEGGPTLLFVHAVNPYGMALYRRANGNNVDLNRSFNLAPVQNPDYDYFDSYLNPKSGIQFYTGLAAGAFAKWRLGNFRTRQAVAAGQMHAPHGIFFTGKEIQREVKIVQDVLRTHLAGVKHLTMIDLHTGLGEFGGEMLFVDHDRETDSPAYFESCFGRRPDVADPSEGAYSIHGRISDAFRKALPEARMRYCLQEFGTLSAGKVLNALRHENFDWRFRPAGTVPPDSIRHQMLDAFLPADPAWRSKIVGLGKQRWNQAWKTLSETPL
ncbi:MAG: DUF2817 domain-containing protein [Bdellovibrionota bacterium]